VDELRQAAESRDWPRYFRLIRETAAQTVKVNLVAPPPECTSRDPWPVGFAVPGPARLLRERAEAAGWVTRVQYSRAAVVCLRGGAWGMERRHFVALRMWHEGRGAHAVVMWESVVDALTKTGKLSWSCAQVKLWTPPGLPVDGALKRPAKPGKGEPPRFYLMEEL